MVGKIYLARIYFTDLSDYKIRPVLVIKDLAEDCICLPLTSMINHPGVKISNSDLSDGTLKKDSIVVFNKSITLHKTILMKYLGSLSPEKFNEVFSAFCSSFGCNDFPG